MSYDVTLREVPAINAMTKLFVTGMGTISQDMGSVFGEVWAHIQQNGGIPTGGCFALYHDEEFDADRMDVEIGFSVEALVPDGSGVIAREVGGGAACRDDAQRRLRQDGTGLRRRREMG
jgi:effector-binding domain-containing protein